MGARGDAHPRLSHLLPGLPSQASAFPWCKELGWCRAYPRACSAASSSGCTSSSRLSTGTACSCCPQLRNARPRLRRKVGLDGSSEQALQERQQAGRHYAAEGTTHAAQRATGKPQHPHLSL